jgi:hypothetical protein
MGKKNPNKAGGMTTVQRMIMPDLIRGRSIEQIAESTGLSTIEVAREWQAYVSNKTEMSPDELLVLHLLRLEHALNMVTLRVENTEASDPDAVKNMLKALEQLEALHGLNKQRIAEANQQVQIITEQQMHMIMRVMLAFQNNLQDHLVNAFTRVDSLEELRSEVLDNFQPWFSAQAQKSLEEAVEDDDVVDGEIVG